MRRKSNFAPSDSEEREDERCMGLHSNDMIEIVCFYMQGCTRMHACVCVCARASASMSTILFSLPETLKLQFFYSAFYKMGSSHCKLLIHSSA